VFGELEAADDGEGVLLLLRSVMSDGVDDADEILL